MATIYAIRPVHISQSHVERSSEGLLLGGHLGFDGSGDVVVAGGDALALGGQGPEDVADDHPEGGLLRRLLRGDGT